MATVAGIFDNPLNANQAITDLLEIGIGRDDVSLMMSDKTRDRFNAVAGSESSRVLSDTTTGSISGGILGALLAGLTAIGTLSIPGIGLLVFGPLIAISAGLGVGVVTGGVVGALVAAGLNQVDASKHADALKAGKAVLVIHNIPDEEVTSIRSILSELADSTKAA